ncbi:MAG: hypothetical protein K5841_02800 [Fretibacterium sp.]|nr:hypothetical protein [Fretibacterium sp.]
MKGMAKRFLLAFCVVLCVASAGWCIDPFKANKDGFGPKIKGVQLGMKMTLLDMVVWGASLENWPLYLKVFEDGNKSRCFINFTGEGHELKGFEVTEVEGKYAPIKNKQGKLGDILAEIEKLGPEAAAMALKLDFNNINNIILNKDMRVRWMHFTQSDFGAEQMTPKEFALAIMDAYHIPGMDGERDGWRHRNLSDGWEIFCNKYDGSISVSPIVTQSKFD